MQRAWKVVDITRKRKNKHKAIEVRKKVVFNVCVSLGNV